MSKITAIEVTKEHAENYLKLDNSTFFSVMCKKYSPDDDWCEITKDDLNEDRTLDEEYQTFQIWY